ncbi:hypothetical protein [Ramlibacter humi]|uniref:Lipoprotein n=1 Tax=Ramlibacter humi TaxID=2530451 RepID=A0A4Z0CD51_9BURK|nr:hypothetical protein [Ramlibacter humi]TFZ08089.1 hypothetical protein EZ216_02690 [Ramlibacter humi]
MRTGIHTSRRWFAVLAFALLAGCATAPPAPQVAIARGERIGVFVSGGDTLRHSHVGTTVFNNFSASYPAPGLQADVQQTLIQAVTRAGFVPVDLRAQGVSREELDGLVQAANGQWQVAPGREGTLARLRNDLKLKAVLAATEGRTMADLECAGGPCSERYIDGPGLYSRSILGLSKYLAVAGYRWNVYTLDTPADLAQTNPLRGELRYQTVLMRDFKEPADFKQLGAPELAVIRRGVVQAVEGAGAQSLRAIGAP